MKTHNLFHVFGKETIPQYGFVPWGRSVEHNGILANLSRDIYIYIDIVIWCMGMSQNRSAPSGGPKLTFFNKKKGLGPLGALSYGTPYSEIAVWWWDLCVGKVYFQYNVTYWLFFKGFTRGKLYVYLVDALEEGKCMISIYLFSIGTCFLVGLPFEN